MLLLKINNKLDLGVEHLEKKLRIVILYKKEELACRQETLKNLHYFIQSEKAHIFKGRLQLFKQTDVIVIEIKGKRLGTISAKNFVKCIPALNEI